MSWKTIVVGYDRSHASNRALSRAAEIAKTEEAHLIVTSIARLLPRAVTSHGVGPFDPADSPLNHRVELDHARELLEGAQVEAEYEVDLGEPGDAIVSLAERRHADLIVVGTHERSLLDRLVHGSVSDAVSKRAHCDVLIVH